MTGFHTVKSLMPEEVKSVIRYLRRSYFHNAFYRSDTDVDTLYNCNSVEYVLELVPMPRTKAKSLFSCINKFRVDGAPLHLLLPTGT